jgi:hypothetical protein
LAPPTASDWLPTFRSGWSVTAAGQTSRSALLG